MKYWVKRIRSTVAFARTGKHINILKNCYFKVTIFNGARSGGLKEDLANSLAVEGQIVDKPGGNIGSSKFSIILEGEFNVE